MTEKDKPRRAMPEPESSPEPAGGVKEARPEERGKAAKFPIDRLRRDCFKLFGVTESTYDAATYGLAGEYAVDEMKKRIEEWQKTPIGGKARKERR